MYKVPVLSYNKIHERVKQLNQVRGSNTRKVNNFSNNTSRVNNKNYVNANISRKNITVGVYKQARIGLRTAFRGLVDEMRPNFPKSYYPFAKAMNNYTDICEKLVCDLEKSRGRSCNINSTTPDISRNLPNNGSNSPRKPNNTRRNNVSNSNDPSAVGGKKRSSRRRYSTFAYA